MEKLKTIKNLEGKEGKEEEKKIRNLVAIGLTSPEIAKRLNYSSSTIRNIKFQLGIYSKEQILNLAELYIDKEVAKIARIDEETVTQVKKAYKTKIPKRLSKEDEKKIREGWALGKGIKEISQETFLTSTIVKRWKEMIGAYSKVQIVQLLEYMSNEEVAKIAKISVKIIEQIKNIEFSKEQEFRMLLTEDGGYEYIMEKYGYASKELVDYYRKKMGAYNRKMIEELLEKKTDDEIAKIAKIPKELVSKIREEAKMKERLKNAQKKVKTKVRNQKVKEKRNKTKNLTIEESKKELKERRNILRQMIQELSEESSASSRNTIEKYIIKLIADLEPYFSTLDYTFVGHAFMKIGLYDEGIMYISTHLGLKDISIVGAQARISEILTNEKQKQENVRKDKYKIEYEGR